MNQTPPTALLIGASSDIALALAHAYAREGYGLVLAARTIARLQADAEDVRLRYKAGVRLVEFDILHTDAHAAFIDGLGTLPEVAVSVVGLLGDQAVLQSSPEAAELVMRSNYLAPALLFGDLANRMEQRGSGVLIGVSSVAGERGRASNYVYGSAKAGFTAFLSGLRHRLVAKGVRVITVKPGFVDTKMTAGMKLPPLLTAQPREVAAAILRAQKRGRQVIYVRPIWWLIMAIIRALPERIFLKMKV